MSLVLFVRVLHCVLLQWFITEATEKSCNYNYSAYFFLRFTILHLSPFLLLFSPHFLPSPFLSRFSPCFFSPECGVRCLLPHPTSLNTAGEELIHASSAVNTAEVQEDVKDLNDKCVLF